MHGCQQFLLRICHICYCKKKITFFLYNKAIGSIGHADRWFTKQFCILPCGKRKSHDLSRTGCSRTYQYSHRNAAIHCAKPVGHTCPPVCCHRGIVFILQQFTVGPRKIRPGPVASKKPERLPHWFAVSSIIHPQINDECLWVPG